MSEDLRAALAASERRTARAEEEARLARRERDEAIESASHCWVLALPPTKDTHKTSWDVQPELRNAQFGDEFGGCEVPEGCLRKNVSQRCVKIYDIMLGKHRIVTKTSKFKGAIRESILAGRMNKLLKLAKRESNESESVGTPPSEPADESERASPSMPVCRT